jgi:hypothetical protein
MSNSKLVMSQAANSWEGPTYIEDVFSTYLYTGNGSTQTITNGIDLSGEGGLVWIKNRPTGNTYHALFDTARGTEEYLMTNVNNASTPFANNGVTSFNSNGFTVAGTSDWWNASGQNIASWTFRKAPRFFDVVTWTGDGTTGRQISHDLNATVGMMILKETSGSGYWGVYHRSVDSTSPEDYVLLLDSTSARIDEQFFINDTAPTSTHFTVGAAAASGGDFNTNGDTYVAYLFAHDPLGPSGDGSDGLIACGSYTGNGSTTGPVIDLGWEPQWLLVKNASASANWALLDVMRGFPVSGSNQHTLLADSAAAELVNTSYQIQPLSDGFQPVSTNGLVNASGNTYIYIAIRRGPMREPESGTEVFAVGYRNQDGDGVAPGFTSGWPVDMAIRRPVTSTTNNEVVSRMTGNTRYLRTNTTDTENATTGYDLDYQLGWFDTATTNVNDYSWMFRRAPGFFDVVAYSGTGSNATIKHNLTVNPEVIIIKRRDAARNWAYYTNLGSSTYTAAVLNDTYAPGATPASYDTALRAQPSSTEFYIGTSFDCNASGGTYIAYLFATLPGVSKVGSYTGNGSSQTINCGFTGGARFVLIKRTSALGDWYVWDTARGIVSGNDPHLSLNTTAAEVTTNDTIDPDSSGFIVNQVAATNVNVSSASYIYLAIA